MIIGALGAGSGIDTAKLAADLSAAARAAADRRIGRLRDRNSAQISAAGALRSGLDGFANALASLARGGTLGAQPRSSDPLAVAVARDPAAAASPATFSAGLTVERLASTQSVASGRFAGPATPVGRGTLRLTLGTFADVAGVETLTPARAPIDIAVAGPTASLAEVRDAVNAARTGVTATLVADGPGTRIVFTGPEGAAGGFTLEALPDSPGSDFATLAFAPGGGGLVRSGVATNARVTFDGLTLERGSNRVTDLVPGYALTLSRADPGRRIALAAAPDAEAANTAARDYVAAYNGIAGLIASYTAPAGAGTTAGQLAGDATARSLGRRLSALTAQRFGDASLAEIGIRTNRDGTLAIDDRALDAATAADPALVERIIVGGGAGAPGLAGAVGRLRDELTGGGGPLTALDRQLARTSERLGRETAAVDTRMVGYSAALGRQLGAMERAVTQYKSVGSFLTQQIDLWTKPTR